MTMPETIDFYGHKLVQEERNWYRATSAAWGEIELSPYSRPERGPWIATWECSPTSYGYAQGYGDTPEQALADLGARMREMAGALWVFFPRKDDDHAT